MEQLEGRAAVITGGGSGIGEALALACSEAGMRVAVSDIEEAEAERVAAAVRGAGGEAIAARADVADPASVEALADRAFEAFGAVHLLCSNAGVMTVAPLMETPIEDWRWTFGVNLFGAVHCVRSFVPRMRAADGAHVLITASIAGVRPIHETPIGVYVASKYAAVGFAETLHQELAPRGVGVSVLCPGGVNTKIFTAGRNRPPELGGPAPPPPPPDAREAEAAAALLMDPAETARRALDGVRAGRLFVFSHPETRAEFEDRCRRVLADYDAVS